MDKMSWKGLNVLVTGADGFIGSHIAKALIERGSNVVTIVRDIKKKSNIDVLGIKDKITIIHSSDKAYGQQKKLPYTEESPLNGYYPYDASKACAELLARSYFMTYALPLAITRNANTYGPADMNMSRIVPDVITSLLKGGQPVIRSDGSPERDYMYIKDAISAYLTLAENLHRKDVLGQAFNFGTGKPVSVLSLYNAIIKAMGKDTKPKILGEAKNEIDRQYLDSSKAKRVLGWESAYSLEQGLKETIEWYKNNTQ